MSEPVDWPDDDAPPRSPRFGDTYFSAENGLEETRAVFLDGCGLPDAWRGRDHFTIGELGFGSGLNILAVVDLWRRTRPSAAARLQLFSVEAYPVSRADAARALARWPELADLAAPLLSAWPDGRRGWRRVQWPAPGVTLDLAVAEVAEALTDWTGCADRWFLDGFAPSRNPEMWREEVLALMAARSAPDAQAASFTVAGEVRARLSALGFVVERRPGFGRKKHRLEARRTGAALHCVLPRVAVVGGGIAGAALGRAFRQLGLAPQIFEAAGAGSGASGNAAALATPRFDAGLGPIAALYAQAFARAAELYGSETPEAVLADGVLQLETAPRDPGRFDRIAAWDGFADGAVTRLDPAQTAGRLDEPAAPGALGIRDGLVIEPAAVLQTWLGPFRTGRVSALERTDGGWRLVDADGAVLDVVDTVVVAAGPASAALAPGLRLQPVRGQVSLSSRPFSGAPAAWGGYAIPTRSGLLFGATHDRNDPDAAPRAEDHDRNLAALALGRPRLAAALHGEPLSARAGVRAATPDHLPLAGPAPGLPGVFVLTGLGGRGFTLAPVLAEALAAEILGLGGPLPGRLWALLRPDRFARAAVTKA